MTRKTRLHFAIGTFTRMRPRRSLLLLALSTASRATEVARNIPRRRRYIPAGEPAGQGRNCAMGDVGVEGCMLLTTAGLTPLLLEPETWRRMVPHLHVDGVAFDGSAPPDMHAPGIDAADPWLAEVVGETKTKGYVRAHGVDWGMEMTKLASAVGWAKACALAKTPSPPPRAPPLPLPLPACFRT